MRTTNLDAIVTSAPVNKDAALARDGGGFHYEPDKNIGSVLRWDAPPPMRPFTATIRGSEGAVDLVGRRVGRLIVLGMLDAATHPKKGAVWVCRCACGAYEGRRAKALKNPLNSHDACQHCLHLIFLKKRDVWLRTGKELPEADFL